MSCTFLILLVVLALLAVVNGISIPKNRLITPSKRYQKDELAIVCQENAVVAKKSLLKVIGPTLASSFVAAALMYPFDLIRALSMANAGSSLTTIELLRNFKNIHGYKGFFTQGLVPEVVKATWARFVKFSLYPICHKLITNGLLENQGTAATKAFAGILASIPEVLTILPLEISKIILQLDTTNKFKNNMFTAISSVYNERGLSGFTIGYTGIQARQSLWTAGYFATLSFFEANVNNIMHALNLDQHESSKAVSQLLSGFLAGVFGAGLNTPCDTIRSNVQKRIFTGY
jgi:solute carrier family 25 2-oxodicarboxylate transporter 21